MKSNWPHTILNVIGVIRSFVGVVTLLVVSLQALPAAGEIQVVDKFQIEVMLVPDKPKIMHGEPTYLSFVVHNHSAQDLQVLVGGDYRNALGRPESFTVIVTGEDGKRVPQPDAGQSFGGLMGPKKVPAKGTYTFKLFLPHWATFENPGTYSIVATRKLKLSEYSGDNWKATDKTTDVQVQASAEIEIVPRDKEKMGAVIAKLGETMLGEPYDGKAESAARMLSAIQDERVIPYFAKALETRDYGRNFTALRTLAKFDNDAAFQALKMGMNTRGGDVGNASTRELANGLAENIRHGAAHALAKSPHPEAIPFLLAQRNDASEGVRITILHVLGKMKPEEAIPILEEMAHDESKRVSDEAKRYLKLLSANE